MTKPPRLEPDGKPVRDVSVNPKATARKASLAEENARAEAEKSEPWTRAKIERELKRARSQEQVVMNGQVIPASLDLHGAEIPDGENLSGLDLSNCNLHGLRAKGVSFRGTDLSKTNLHGAVLDGCDLSDVEIEGTNLCESCCCGSKVAIRRREPEPGKPPRPMSFRANFSGACVEGCGLDVQEKPLTEAEKKAAERRRSEGYRIHVSLDEGKVRYVGSELSEANVTGLSLVCKRKK